MRIRCVIRAVGFFQLALVLSAGHSVLSAGHSLAGDWPMWRYDSARRAATPHNLPDELHLQWVRQLPQTRPAWPASQTKLQFDVSYEPVVLGRRMFVGSTVNDSITAYDTRTGKEVWRFYTNGPVRFAPIAQNGRRCAYQNQTSLALIHMPEAELWTYGAAAFETARIDRIGLNFGAPGDRRDVHGTLWLDYPSVGGPSPRVDVQVIAENPTWFRRHSAFVNGKGPTGWRHRAGRASNRSY